MHHVSQGLHGAEAWCALARIHLRISQGRSLAEGCAPRRVLLWVWPPNPRPRPLRQRGRCASYHSRNGTLLSSLHELVGELTCPQPYGRSTKTFFEGQVRETPDS